MNDRYPKVFVTRRLRKDGSAYYGPYFPGNLAYRLVDLIHRSFLIPSCKVDLSRYHPRACLQYYIKRCLGPCLEGLTTPESYRQTIRDVQLFLEGRPSELEHSLTQRMEEAAEAEQFELAARLRDQISTVHQMQDKQRMATTDNEDADVFGYHYENEMLAVNLFHMRGGKIVDRRDLFWEDLPESLLDAVTEAVSEAEELETVVRMEPDPAAPAPEIGEGLPVVQHAAVSELGAAFSPAAFFSALLKQIYLDQSYVPRSILVPVEFPDRALLAEILTERTGRRVEILAPQRGEKRSLVDLVCQNAKQSYDQRFRVLQPGMKAIQEALQDALTLEELPRRIECFDISHIQGAETVASLVVWEDGKMNKSAYRKFKVKTVAGVDDFASMREVVERRYRRIRDHANDSLPRRGDENVAQGASPGSQPQIMSQAPEGRQKLAPADRDDDGESTTSEGRSGKSKEPTTMPSLILVDGGLGQLHAAADALESLGFTSQPLASIAKREEVIYLYGNEDEPIVLDRRSPVLHLVQLIRDESHRFAVGYHRQRRAMRDRDSELLNIPGVGAQTRQRLLTHFGSLRDVQQATAESLAAVVSRKTAETIWQHFHPPQPANQIGT
jgi:excinuclease ABC subunit C